MLAMTVTVNPQNRPPVPPSVSAKRRFLEKQRLDPPGPRQAEQSPYAKINSQVQIRTAEKPRMEMKLKFRYA